ncbi:MAG: hypothetical protein HC811_03075 [Flammeovirgaceae bacterium]|nr:hypothetical protein [Flammeovirgaceae bacterium]
MVQKGDFTLGGGVDYIEFTSFQPRYVVSLNGENRIGQHFTTFFVLDAARDYLHFGPGTIFLPLGLLLLNSDESSFGDFLSGLLFVGTSLEHIGYSLPMGHHAEIIPYVSMLRFRFMWDGPTTPGNGNYVSGSLGVKLQYLFKERWYTSAHVEYSQLYYSGRPGGIESGVSVNYIVKSNTVK